MMQYVAAALAAAIIGLGIAYALQQRQVASLEAENARLTSSVAAYKAAGEFREASRRKAVEAAQVASQREQEAIAALNKLIRELDDVEIPDSVGALLRCLQSGSRACGGPK